MALLLYPNISGLEMVLFFVVVGFSFFNFTVAKKKFKPQSFGVVPSSPRLPRSEDTKIPRAGDCTQYKNSSDQSTKVRLF